MAVVIGTSGLTADDFAEIDAAARERGTGVIAAGNFSLTAAMTKAAALLAARHLPSWEVIDYASATKADAPSGTARELAERSARRRPRERASPRHGGRARGARRDDRRHPGPLAAAAELHGLDRGGVRAARRAALDPARRRLVRGAVRGRHAAGRARRAAACRAWSAASTRCCSDDGTLTRFVEHSASLAVVPGRSAAPGFARRAVGEFLRADGATPAMLARRAARRLRGGHQLRRPRLPRTGRAARSRSRRAAAAITCCSRSPTTAAAWRRGSTAPASGSGCRWSAGSPSASRSRVAGRRRDAGQHVLQPGRGLTSTDRGSPSWVHESTVPVNARSRIEPGAPGRAHGASRPAGDRHEPGDAVVVGHPRRDAGVVDGQRHPRDPRVPAAGRVRQTELERTAPSRGPRRPRRTRCRRGTPRTPRRRPGHGRPPAGTAAGSGPGSRASRTRPR